MREREFVQSDARATSVVCGFASQAPALNGEVGNGLDRFRTIYQAEIARKAESRYQQEIHSKTKHSDSISELGDKT